MTDTLFLLSSAYKGDPAVWADDLDQHFHSVSPVLFNSSYNCRRLDKMVACAVEAAAVAVQNSGLSSASFSQFNVAGVSHNGPCIYSEEFYGELVEAENPELISPMLFSESVLNIVPSHVAISLGARSGVFALITDLVHFFDIFKTLILLVHSGSWETGLLCATEEFSPLATKLFATCNEYPGVSFVDGALACVFSARPLQAADNVGITLSSADTRDEMQRAMQKIRAADGRVFLSAYSEGQEPEVEMQPPLLSVDDMQRQQGFMITRLAEVVKLAQAAEKNAPTVLLQAVGTRWEWLTCTCMVS